MSGLQEIEKTLAQAGKRRRRERAFRGMWFGLLIGASIWCLAVAVYKLLPVPVWTLRAAAGVGLTSAVIGAIVGGWRRNSVSETARWVDGRQHLQERLSTALELSKTSGSGSETWRELLVSDAAEHLKLLDPRRLVQFRLTRSSHWAILLLALGVGLIFVPAYRTKAFVQKQTDQNTIHEAGRQLVELTKNNLKSRPPALENTQKAMDAVNQLGEQLAKKTMTRTEAVKDLAKVAEQVKEEMKQLTKEPAVRRMEEAARSAGENSPENAQLKKQVEEAQKKMGDSTATPDNLDKMNKEMSKLQDSAKADSDKNGGLSQNEKEQLSQSLGALAKQAQAMGMNMPNLDQAIQALAASDTGLFLKDMKASLKDLEKMRDDAQSLQALQQQMQKSGKDLAEQLQKGQPETAQATLQKMIDQLQSPGTPPEQASQILSEVSKAVDPAGKYGKAGDYLKQAAQQMQQGQKPGAAQSLASAAKELERMVQQAGDAQALMAEMDALSKAQMSVGTGNHWGMGNGNGQGDGKGNGKPGAGKGGKGGAGVGTWADEMSGWGYNPMPDGQDDLVDNSGVKRPDTAGRGHSDRGNGDLNPSLKPTQEPGHFQPGGEMPSITLKGVSIAGTSTVSLQQAVVAAQEEAQSALTKEEVPRAYQAAVRDYFDDSKK